MSFVADSSIRRIEAAFAARGVAEVAARGRPRQRPGDRRARRPAGGARLGLQGRADARTASRQHERGALDLAEAVAVPVERTAGETGLAAMRDPVRISLRDLAYLAIAVSDNAAADVLFDAVGDDPIEQLLADLALATTRIPQRCRDMTAALMDDTGARDTAEVSARLHADPALLGRLRVRDPRTTNASTARDMTSLLAAIWEDRAAAPESCAAVRRLMSLQVWPHRLASGFAEDGFGVAGKTGTLPGIRNEIGVVRRPDGGHRRGRRLHRLRFAGLGACRRSTA